MQTLNQSFVLYEFVCPGCSANYVGKTERTLFERNVEHAWKVIPITEVPQKIFRCILKINYFKLRDAHSKKCLIFRKGTQISYVKGYIWH